jgi:cellulose biosynthesis protein BcsQ
MSDIKLMERNDFQLLMKLRTKSRFHSNDINELAGLYEKYINVRLKRIVDYNCPFCLKECRDQLITYQEECKIKEDYEAEQEELLKKLKTIKKRKK